MRHALAALGVIALSVTLASWTSPAEAKKDPEAQLEKAASKAAKKIAKATAKRIKSLAKAKAKEIKLLTKAVKTGKGLEELSGVPSPPRSTHGEPSFAQLSGACDRVAGAIFEYADGACAAVQDGFADLATAPSIVAIQNVSRPFNLAGCGGPGEVAQGLLSGATEAGALTVMKAVGPFKDACRAFDFDVMVINCMPPKFNPPTLGAGDDSLTSANQPMFTICSNDKKYACWLPAPAGSPGGSTPQPRMGVFRSDGGLYNTFGSAPQSGSSVLFFQSADNTGDRGGYDAALVSAVLGPGGGFRPQGGTAPFSNPGRGIRPAGSEAAGFFIELIGASDLSEDTSVGLQEGSDCDGSDPSTPTCRVEPGVDQVYCTWTRLDPGASKVAQLNDALFPCGQGPNGFTVCANIPAADPGGDEIVVVVAYGADIPLADNVNSYQFGFVFDQDGNTRNNYVPIPRFENDFYRDSDKWYSLEYTPATGWELKVTDARNNNFTPVASAARAVINGEAIMLAVPASEFAVAAPAFRTTSFRHTGDFGLNPPHDYSADYDPRPGQPLRPFSSE